MMLLATLSTILLSAPLVPSTCSTEIAMSKCSTDTPAKQMDQESTCPKRDRDRGSCDSCDSSKKGCNTDQSDASEQMTKVRKSAAQKVVDGQ